MKPSCVYRLQFGKECTFDNATALLPYLHSLGIDGIYCSPIYDATSPHGYDVRNPLKTNPLLGDFTAFSRFCQQANDLNIRIILDVVPNHMSIQSKWWLDVLEYGTDSPFANFFDITWDPLPVELRGKILLPILGEFYGEALEKQKISLQVQEGFFSIVYGAFRLPLSIPSTQDLFDQLPKAADLAASLHSLTASGNNRVAQAKEIKKLFSSRWIASEDLRKETETLLQKYVGKLEDASSFDALHNLLEEQIYRLSHWHVAGQEINYRRFFSINDLVALRMEDEKVFTSYHQWIKELIESKAIKGLRIDHIDGLYDPEQYLNRVKQWDPPLLVVEKILDETEELPKTWPIDGTVGYEFLNALNGIFIKKKEKEHFSRFYCKFIGYSTDYSAIVYQRKKFFIQTYMGSEVYSLGYHLTKIAKKSRYFRDFTRVDLTRALQEILADFPVYRTYINSHQISHKDRELILHTIERAKQRTLPELDPSIFDFMRDVLLIEISSTALEEANLRDFVMRFQQLTAPLAAKGVEDTAFYVYNRLLSLNEVGGNPFTFGLSPPEFHQFNKDKHQKWPYGFLPANTHDAKRSEEVRMRLNALTELSEEWSRLVFEWKKMNLPYKRPYLDQEAPDLNTEYFIYQTLLGIWPLQEQEAFSETFRERVWQGLLKSMREAWSQTSWWQPNLEYEEAVRQFLFSLITPNSSNLFYPSFLAFSQKINRLGLLNTLSATVIRIGSCGIYDLYQGHELWNFTLADPDNRRPVHFEKLKERLKFLKKEGTEERGLKNLLSETEGLAKMYIQWKGLNFRRSNKSLFLEGKYLPLRINGEKKEHLIAFLRQHEKQVALILAARFFHSLSPYNELPIQEVWQETEISLPQGLEKEVFTDIFTGHSFKLRKREKNWVLSAKELFSEYPFAILTNQKNDES